MVRMTNDELGALPSRFVGEFTQMKSKSGVSLKSQALPIIRHSSFEKFVICFVVIQKIRHFFITLKLSLFPPPRHSRMYQPAGH